MDFPVKQGDQGSDVVAVQQALNRLGMLLTCDGKFGPGTGRAVSQACEILQIAPRSEVDAPLWELLSERPDPCPDLPTQGVTFIAQAEVTSRQAYEQSYSHPTWPSPESGITIGIGYDLQFSDEDQFRTDWGAFLPSDDLLALLPWLKRVGSQQGVDDLKSTHQSFYAAWSVFCDTTIPQTIIQCRTTFPGYDALPGLCRSALVSLVYNRGPSLNGPSRVEMRTIHDLILAGNLAAVPEQFRNMKRLWQNLPGLVTRREGEAQMWEQGLQSS